MLLLIYFFCFFFDIIPAITRPYLTRNTNNIPYFNVKYDFLKNTFIPSVTIELNKLDSEINNAPSLNIFKYNILKFRPASKNIYLTDITWKVFK